MVDAQGDLALESAQWPRKPGFRTMKVSLQPGLTCTLDAFGDGAGPGRVQGLLKDQARSFELLGEALRPLRMGLSDIGAAMSLTAERPSAWEPRPQAAAGPPRYRR
jgi:hypothetical protein